MKLHDDSLVSLPTSDVPVRADLLFEQPGRPNSKTTGSQQREPKNAQVSRTASYTPAAAKLSFAFRRMHAPQLITRYTKTPTTGPLCFPTQEESSPKLQYPTWTKIKHLKVGCRWWCSLLFPSLVIYSRRPSSRHVRLPNIYLASSPPPTPLDFFPK